METIESPGQWNQDNARDSAEQSVQVVPRGADDEDSLLAPAITDFEDPTICNEIGKVVVIEETCKIESEVRMKS